MRFREIEKIILQDGWQYKNTKGSHCQYIHPTKPGKVTIPNHPGDIAPQIIKQILRKRLCAPRRFFYAGGLPSGKEKNGEMCVIFCVKDISGGACVNLRQAGIDY